MMRPPEPSLSPIESLRVVIEELKKQFAEADEQLLNTDLTDKEREKLENTRHGISILLDQADNNLFNLEQQEARQNKL